MACTDMRATMSESRTREVTYSLHSEGTEDGWKERKRDKCRIERG
jgi:hypothetical protein